MRNPREDFLVGLVGLPWQANARGPDTYDCWHLAAHIEQFLFSRGTPNIDVPEHPTWRWMLDQFTSHRELMNWVERKHTFGQQVTSEDGAIVLMARSERPAHCGVWLRAEQLIIHCDQKSGVVCEDILQLRSAGWAKLRFYEPKVA